MQRLTIEKGLSDLKKRFENENSWNAFNFVTRVENKISKLQAENQQYKDKLADGRMIEMPCKIGDTVYVLIQRNVTTEIVKGTVENIQHYNTWWVEFSNLWVDKTFDDFGKTAFLTREEAEQALKEMEN